MRVNWHCRGCNETGAEDFDLEKILKEKRDKEVLITLIQRLVPHDCTDRNIGIKTT